MPVDIIGNMKRRSGSTLIGDALPIHNMFLSQKWTELFSYLEYFPKSNGRWCVFSRSKNSELFQNRPDCFSQNFTVFSQQYVMA